jgi:sodium-dependent dicarboxylate transporter 2/3/5
MAELEEGLPEGELWRRRIGLLLGPVAALSVWLIPSNGFYPSGQAHRLGAILVLCAIYWVTEAIPLPATALLGASLAVLLGVANAQDALAPFADPVIYLLIGSLIVARAMMFHRLDRRIALAVLSAPIVGNSPRRVMIAYGLVCACISMWISNTATTAMMVPIGLGILAAMQSARAAPSASPGAGPSASLGAGPSASLRAGPSASLGAGPSASLRAGPSASLRAGPSASLRAGSASPEAEKEDKYRSGLMLMCSYAGSVGGTGTPVGSPPNLIGLGMIRRLAGRHIGFLTWMLVSMPMLAVVLACLSAILVTLHPAGSLGRKSEGASGGAQGIALSEHMRTERQRLGRWTRGQINVLIIFLVAVCLWMAPGILAVVYGAGSRASEVYQEHLPEAMVAVIAAVLLFLVPVNVRKWEPTLPWSEASKIDWGTMLLFGGGLSLGRMMFSTGLAKSLGSGLMEATGAHGLWQITGVSIAVAIALSELASNTASASMVIPVMVALAKEAGVSPLPPALGATLGASYGFMLPVSTPPNAIVYGTGLVRIGQMVRAGVLLDFIGFVCIYIGLRLLCPILGLE